MCFLQTYPSFCLIVNFVPVEICCKMKMKVNQTNLTDKFFSTHFRYITHKYTCVAAFADNNRHTLSAFSPSSAEGQTAANVSNVEAWQWHNSGYAAAPLFSTAGQSEAVPWLVRLLHLVFLLISCLDWSVGSASLKENSCTPYCLKVPPWVLKGASCSHRYDI